MTFIEAAEPNVKIIRRLTRDLVEHERAGVRFAVAERFSQRGDEDNFAQVVRIIRDGAAPLYMAIPSLTEENELKDRGQRASKAVQEMKENKVVQILLMKANIDETEVATASRKEADSDMQEATATIADAKKKAKAKKWSKEDERTAYEFLTLNQFAIQAVLIQRNLDKLDKLDQDEQHHLRTWLLLNYAKRGLKARPSLGKSD